MKCVGVNTENNTLPLFTPPPPSSQSRSGQLGLEGFVMGSSYVLFSACISVMVYGLPHVKDARLRGGLSAAAAAAAALLGLWVFAAYNAKTGMSMRSFFF